MSPAYLTPNEFKQRYCLPEATEAVFQDWNGSKKFRQVTSLNVLLFITRINAHERIVEPDWSTIRYLTMDEYVLHKGHRYATIVADPIGQVCVHQAKQLRHDRPARKVLKSIRWLPRNRRPLET